MAGARVTVIALSSLLDFVSRDTKVRTQPAALRIAENWKLLFFQGAYGLYNLTSSFGIFGVFFEHWVVFGI